MSKTKIAAAVVWVVIGIGILWWTWVQWDAGERRAEPQKWEAPRIIKGWQGTGIKTTEVFEIKSRQWRIKWENKDSFLQIFVYHASGELVTLCANVLEKGKDTSYVYKSGNFYLMINAGGAWKVTVEEKGES